MKIKTLVAALAATLAGGAYAQSSVTLYGVADAGVEYLSNAGPGGDNKFSLKSGNLSGSRWGLRGVEDLGGGLKGIFVLESGFAIDSGTSTQDNRLFGRQAYVGLQGGFGSLTLGRQQNSIYDLIINYDPFAFASSYSAASLDGEFTGRADNAIKYTGTFAGLTATGFYSFGRDVATGAAGEVPGEGKADRQFGGGLSYANGPFGIGVAYDNQNGGVSALGQRDQRLAAGASFAFGPVKTFAGYRWREFRSAGGVKSGSDIYWLGLSYQATPALALTGAAYLYNDYGTKQDPWLFVLGADYALSKRTDAYLTVAYAKNKDKSALGVGGFNGGVNGARGSTINVKPGDNQTGAVIGIRHKF
jgi:predicted porin